MTNSVGRNSRDLVPKQERFATCFCVVQSRNVTLGDRRSTLRDELPFAINSPIDGDVTVVALFECSRRTSIPSF